MSETANAVYGPFMSSLALTTSTGTGNLGSGLSGVLNESDFSIAKQLLNNGYISGKVGPTTMKEDKFQVADLMLTVSGRQLMDSWKTPSIATKYGATVVKWVAGVLSTIIAAYVLYAIGTRKP